VYIYKTSKKSKLSKNKNHTLEPLQKKPQFTNAKRTTQIKKMHKWGYSKTKLKTTHVIKN
jgi:hypothetical protein